MSQIPFLLVLWLFCLSRHNVVAPSLAAPLLIDIRQATMEPGTCEDIVTKPDEMRSWTHQGWYEVPPFNVVQMKMRLNDVVFFGNVTANGHSTCSLMIIDSGVSILSAQTEVVALCLHCGCELSLPRPFGNSSWP